MSNFIKKLYWRFKRWDAESDLYSAEHKLNFKSEFFQGSLSGRYTKKWEKKSKEATKRLKIADKKCKELNI